MAVTSSSNKFASALTSAFASSYGFVLKAQNFHWNTEGRMFYADHLLFERIYEEVDGSIDTFAENIRKLQMKVPAGLGALNEISAIEDCVDEDDPEQMIQELLNDSDSLIDIFRELFTVAENMGEHGLSNFLADRQDAFSKHSWMLRSSLKGS
jgi:starvation-inducible DNA-binding protein